MKFKLSLKILSVAIMVSTNAYAGLSYNVDLSEGTLTNSRHSTGYLTDVSPTSITIVGSDSGIITQTQLPQ